MIKTIDAINLSDNTERKAFEYDCPKICPMCETALGSSALLGFYIYIDDQPKGFLYNLFLCPKCSTCFLGFYMYESVHLLTTRAKILYYSPQKDFSVKFSGNIESLSPSFVKIFNQSSVAEKRGLNEISGMGYRKALEFLVKDYAIFANPNDLEKINPMPLSECINTYVDHPHIKALAKASAWIGNDETHYVRKHDDYGIEHLKAFIDAIVSMISAELSYIQATNLLEQKK